MAEIAYNASVNRTTGKSPFEIVYGVIPKQVTDLVECDHLIQGVEELLRNIQTVQEEALKQIEFNTNKYKEEVNRHRSP